MKKNMPNVLIISGFAPTNLAGYGCDIRLADRLSVHPLGVITALTSQVPGEFSMISEVDPLLIKNQLKLHFSNYKISSLKTGMIYSESLCRIISGFMDKVAGVSVVDPVFNSSTGRPLLLKSAFDSYKKNIISKAGLITPNYPEAVRISGLKDGIKPRDLCLKIYSDIRVPVLLKGGHIDDSRYCTDLFFDGKEFLEWKRKRRKNLIMHGTGCRLSSAIAAFSARGYSLREAIARAEKYMTGLFNRPGVMEGKAVLSC